MIDMVSNIEERGIFDTGEYMVIHVDLEAFHENKPVRYFQSKLSFSYLFDPINNFNRKCKMYCFRHEMLRGFLIHVRISVM